MSDTPHSAPRRRITLSREHDGRVLSEPIAVTHRREDDVPHWLTLLGVILVALLFMAAALGVG